MKKVLLLYSGGLDSSVLLHLAQQIGMAPHCLGIDYGQKHIRELEKAELFCNAYGIPYQRSDIQLEVHSRLTGDLQSEYKGVSEWYVPSRNLMFISIAASHAENFGIDLIWLGANYDDRLNLFPDCSQEWIVKVNELLKINASYPITVEAPLLGFPKERVQMLANHLGIKEEEVHSGYSE